MGAHIRARGLILLVSVGALVYGAASHFSELDAWLSRTSASPQAQPTPRVADPKYFIDVWKLRHDVAAVEEKSVNFNPDICHRELPGYDPEADPGKPPSEAEIAAETEIGRQEAACDAQMEEARHAYRDAEAALNATWQPLINRAIQAGDPVAEVIMRQCDTTQVLDRSHIESTCSKDPQARALAASRLREIGFAPAFDWDAEFANVTPRSGANVSPQKQADDRQKLLREQFSHGAFGRYGDEPAPAVLSSAANPGGFDVLVAAIQTAPRAFTFSPGADEHWATQSFARLSLNRRPLTPGVLTWGPELMIPGSNKPGATGGYFPRWRVGRLSNIPRETNPAVYSYIDDVRDLIARSEASIDAYLRQDPRWGVFLLHRIGHHEWVPEGMPGNTGKLGPEWLGEWRLEQTYKDWGTFGDSSSTPKLPQPHGAQITQEGGVTRIAFHTRNNTGFPEDAAACTLRYSGARTNPPRTGQLGRELIPQGQLKNNQEWSYTMLGNLEKDCSNEHRRSGAGSAMRGGSQCQYPSYANGAAFAPLDPAKQYEQILVQCPEGESTDTDHVRFLLLKGDTLVEFAAEYPNDVELYVRHYRRVRGGHMGTQEAGR